jgi:hypothetical protein
MKRIIPALVCGILAAGRAEAQAPTQIPWDAPPAAARAQLLQAGFSVAGTDTAATYTRSAGRVREQVYIRRRGGQLWSITYSAVGDSASLQAKLDDVASGQVARAGAGQANGPLRVWNTEGGRRLALPTHPFLLPDGATWQFMIVYSRP